MTDYSYQETGYVETPARLENVSQIATTLKTYCRYRGINEADWPQIELGFCEAMNNAIEHACGEDESKIIIVRWEWAKDWLVISIDDPGDFKGIDTATSLPHDPLSESGRGSFLMESTMDQVAHEPCQHGHRTIMKKQLHIPRPLIDRLEEMYIQLQQTTAELNKSSAKLSALESLTSDLAATPDPLEIIRNGINRILEFGTNVESEVWLAIKDGLHCEVSVPNRSTTPPILFEKQSSIVIDTYLKQKPFFFADTQNIDPDDPALRNNAAATLLLPISFHGKPQGVLVIHSPLSEATALRNEIADIADGFAKLFGIAIASGNAQSREEEREKSQTQLEVASEIQRSLLPSQFPANKHCKVTGTCVAAMEVGGDYIDAVEIRDAGLLIVIADVMGKGVPAALLATIFRTAIRSRLNLAETPGWLLSKINKQIHDELGHLNMFITAQAAFYTYDKKMLKLASAGHCPALLTQKDANETTQLSAEGMPLGIDPDDLYEERLISMNTGDRVLFLTDGMYEAENPQGQMLGIDGLSQRLPEIWEKGLDSVTERAFSVVENHIAGLPPSDDKTLMALEIL